MSFLKNKYAGVLTVLLILQGVVFYTVALRAENTPATAPLSYFPTDTAGWQMYKDVKIEQETLDVLKADDTLNRVYINPSAQREHLSVYRLFQDAAVRAGATFAEELPTRKRL